jgi:hypothetical protein
MVTILARESIPSSRADPGSNVLSQIGVCQACERRVTCSPRFGEWSHREAGEWARHNPPAAGEASCRSVIETRQTVVAHIAAAHGAAHKSC